MTHITEANSAINIYLPRSDFNSFVDTQNVLQTTGIGGMRATLSRCALRKCTIIKGGAAHALCYTNLGLRGSTSHNWFPSRYNLPQTLCSYSSNAQLFSSLFYLRTLLNVFYLSPALHLLTYSAQHCNNDGELAIRSGGEEGGRGTI